MTQPSDDPSRVKKTTGNLPGAGPGRPKGVPNKITTDVKAMVLGALEASGGQQYLMDRAKDQPVAFMSLLGRILPTQVTGDADNPLRFVLIGAAESMNAMEWKEQAKLPAPTE